MEQKKKLTEKQLFIIVGIPAIIIMIFIMYYMFTGGGSSNSDTSNQDTLKSSAILLPEVKEDTLPKKKSSIYDELDMTEAEKEEQKKRMESEDFYQLGDESKTAGKKVESEPVQQTKSSNSYSSSTSNKPKKKVVKQTTTQKTSNNTQQTASTQQNTSPEYSFGVYKASKGGSTSNVSSSNKSSSEFIPAVLEKSMKIRPGSEVIFILQKATTIDGVFFDKMSIMYGMAKFTGTRVDIKINMIQDKKGKKHPVSLYAYNENYQQGIFYTDKVENATSKARTKVVSSATNRVLGGTVAGEVVNTGTQLMEREQSEINVAAGYKMYFK